MLDIFYQNKQKILKKSQDLFINSSSFYPKFGCELEFFLFKDDSDEIPREDEVRQFIKDLESDITKKFSIIHKLEKEGGASQIELKTNFTSDLNLLCHELEEIKLFINDYAQNKNFIVSFVAQPFLNDCGSSLQFNISLHDKDGDNIFLHNADLLTKYSESLLNYTDEMLLILAPKQEDYLRFLSKVNIDLFKIGKFIAPMNLSFGADNRTCAIRIPALKTDDESRRHYGKRIEYRIASPNADPYLSIAVILIAMSQDSDEKFEQIFGNAFDKQYNVREFSKNFEEAQNNFQKGKIKNELELFLSS